MRRFVVSLILLVAASGFSISHSVRFPNHLGFTVTSSAAGTEISVEFPNGFVSRILKPDTQVIFESWSGSPQRQISGYLAEAPVIVLSDKIFEQVWLKTADNDRESVIVFKNGGIGVLPFALTQIIYHHNLRYHDENFTILGSENSPTFLTRVSDGFTVRLSSEFHFPDSAHFTLDENTGVLSVPGFFLGFDLNDLNRPGIEHEPLDLLRPLTAIDHLDTSHQTQTEPSSPWAESPSALLPADPRLSLKDWLASQKFSKGTWFAVLAILLRDPLRAEEAQTLLTERLGGLTQVKLRLGAKRNTTLTIEDYRGLAIALAGIELGADLNCEQRLLSLRVNLNSQ